MIERNKPPPPHNTYSLCDLPWRSAPPGGSIELPESIRHEELSHSTAQSLPRVSTEAAPWRLFVPAQHLGAGSAQGRRLGGGSGSEYKIHTYFMYL